jgi:hypothetical protein
MRVTADDKNTPPTGTLERIEHDAHQVLQHAERRPGDRRNRTRARGLLRALTNVRKRFPAGERPLISRGASALAGGKRENLAPQLLRFWMQRSKLDADESPILGAS